MTSKRKRSNHNSSKKCCCCIPLRFGLFLFTVLMLSLNIFLLDDAIECNDTLNNKNLNIAGFWCSSDDAAEHVPEVDGWNLDVETILVNTVGKAYGITFSCCGWTR